MHTETRVCYVDYAINKTSCAPPSTPPMPEVEVYFWPINSENANHANDQRQRREEEKQKSELWLNRQQT